METLIAHWPAFGLLSLYFGLMIHNAVIGKQRTKSLADYYVGGRNMGGVVIGFSVFATIASTNSYIGAAGLSYKLGAPWLLTGITMVAFTLAAWNWVAPRLRHFTEQLGSLTIPDFLAFRFNSRGLRVAAAVVVILSSILYMTAIFKGIGNALQIYLGIPYEAAIGLVYAMVVLYTAAGGFISVVRTDVAQGTVMIIAAVILFSGTVKGAGGLMAIQGLAQSAAGETLFSWNGAMPLSVLLGIIMAMSIKLIVEPRMLSRFYALRDHKAIVQGKWVSLGSMIVVFSLLMPIGLYARVIFPEGDIDTDLIVPTLIGGGMFFDTGTASFLLVALVAAAMSSLDSVLLVTGTTCQRDLVGQIWHQDSDQAALRWTRGLVILFATLTAAFSLNPPGGIIAITAFSGSVYGACFFPGLIFGLYWRRGNGQAVLASMGIGLGVLGYWTAWPPVELHAVFPSMAASIIAYVLVARMTPPVMTEQVDALFRKPERV